MGESGFGNPLIAAMTTNTAEPLQTFDFIAKTIGLQATPIPDELAKIVFRFTRPTMKLLTLTEAKTDDVYSFADTTKTVNGSAGIGITRIYTNASLVSVVIPDDRVRFGADVTRYIVTAVTATYLDIQFGLLYALSGGEAIYLGTKTAESSTTARQFRVNTAVGAVADITYTDPVTGYISRWQVTTTLGSWEDLNKCLATINEATRLFTAEYLLDGGATPALLTVVGEHAIGATTITLSADPTGIISPGDYINFGGWSNTFYVVATVGSTSIILTAALTERILDASIILHKLTPGTVTGYDALALSDFYGTVPMSDLKGYKLYHSENPQSPGDLGTMFATYLTTATTVSNFSDGSTELTMNATTTYFDGRKLYWALVVIDANDAASMPDTGVWANSYPGQAHLISEVLDQVALTATLTYENITAAARNPLLDVAMGSSLTQYSTTGGYTIYSKLMTAIDLAAGTYTPVSATLGSIVSSAIIAGDMIFITGINTGHKWRLIAAVNGLVEFDDADLISGTTGYNYNIAWVTATLAAYRAAIVAGDNVLPNSPDATPLRQYLTDFQNTHTITLAVLGVYAFTIESTDPAAGLKGK